jgi:hypothetical protein
MKTLMRSSTETYFMEQPSAVDGRDHILIFFSYPYHFFGLVALRSLSVLACETHFRIADDHLKYWGVLQEWRVDFEWQGRELEGEAEFDSSSSSVSLSFVIFRKNKPLFPFVSSFFRVSLAPSNSRSTLRQTFIHYTYIIHFHIFTSTLTSSHVRNMAFDSNCRAK